MKNSSVQPNPLTDPIIPAIRSAALVTAVSTTLYTYCTEVLIVAAHSESTQPT